MVIKNIKEIVATSEDVLEIIKYSHFNPTEEKLSKLVQKYHENKVILPSQNIWDSKTEAQKFWKMR